jgi:zinc and cadmium transporter
MALPLVLFSLAVVAVSLLGGALPLWATVTHTRLQVYLSFAAGVMLGAAFFHMLPEAVELGGPVFGWTLGGLLTLFLLERFCSYHHHEAPGAGEPTEAEHGCSGNDHHHGHSHQGPRKSIHWGAAAVGLAVHSLTGGVALATAVATDFGRRGELGPASWGVFLATLVHKPADALTIVSLMLRGGVSSPRAHLVNLGFALMIPLGVAAFLIGLGGLSADRTEAIMGAAMAFSAGTFLCIALSDLLPEIHFHSHDRLKLSLALLAGVALMGMTMAGHGPHAPQPGEPAEQAHEH